MVATWGKNQERGAMRIKKEDCAGLVIDLQERLFPVMFEGEELLERVQVLLQGLKIMDIPVLFTEQYPKGLGTTLEPVKVLIGEGRAIEKISFSCCGDANFDTRLSELNRKRVIICGIESHVCVLQTAIDLHERGFTPVVVADGISSRNPGDKKVALERMQGEGAIVTTCESILFELAGAAGTPEFKSISKLVK